MKQLALAISLAASVAAIPVMATEAPATDFADAHQVFQMTDGSQLQVASLSGQEMHETEGAWVNFAAMGAAGGFFGGLSYANAVPANQRTWRGWTMAVGSGAAAGMIGGAPLGVFRTAYYGGTVGFVGNSWATSSWGRR